jgi:hypothetical protein
VFDISEVIGVLAIFGMIETIGFSTLGYNISSLSTWRTQWVPFQFDPSLHFKHFELELKKPFWQADLIISPYRRELVERLSVTEVEVIEVLFLCFNHAQDANPATTTIANNKAIHLSHLVLEEVFWSVGDLVWSGL